VLVLIGASSASAADPGSGYRNRAAQLQVQAQKLDTKAHRALLDLYSLDTRLGAAQSRLASLRARSQRLRKQQAVLARELTAARQTLALSREELAQHLRNLYEQGGIDPLAVVLGAQSLNDAISRLDGLTRVADLNRRVVAATSAADARLVHVQRTLVSRRHALDRSLSAARTSARDLASARAERVSFIQGLRTEQQLKTHQIAALQEAAARVERKSQLLQAAASASAADPAPASAGGDPAPASTSGDPAGTPTTPAAETPAAPTGGGRTMRVSATGYSLPGHTATGLPVGWGIVAVDPSVIPLGTRLSVPGYGEAVAADVGSAVRGATIDLWFPTVAEALAWGRRWVTITIH